jgi:hypothetical protein
VLSILANSVVVGFLVAMLAEVNFVAHFLALVRLYPSGAAALVILLASTAMPALAVALCHLQAERL